MSMKRSKQVSRVRGKEGDDPAWFSTSKAAGKSYTWAEDVAAQPDEAFAAYALGTRFARGALVRHPKFGKGVVTLVEGPRIEVLFEEGAKKLGHAG